MKKLFFVYTLFVPILLTVGIWNYVPMQWLSISEPTLGTSITTINATDTLKDSRAVINSNFANLNADKLESGSTAAALTITSGTITSGTIGTLSLTNPLSVSSGGTGSSTLSLNQLLLGNGTNNVKTPLGWGTSGQFLQSAGFGSPPAWSNASVDLAANYNWTGFHDFNAGVRLMGTSSIQASFAEKLTINGLDYAFPLSHRATSSPLVSDGAGNLSWGVWTVLFASGSSGSTALTATTTLETLFIPANTLRSSNSMLRLTVNGFNAAPSGSCYFQVDYGTGFATSTMGWVFAGGSGAREGATLISSISATSTSNQFSTTQGYTSAAPSETVSSLGTFMRAYHAVDTTARSYIDIRAKTSISASCDVENYMLEVLSP